MKNKLPLFLLLMGLLMIGFSGCKKAENNDVRVTTYTPQDITQTTAKCGGDVIVTQGLSLNELGVCWSTDRNPTVEDTHLSTPNWSEPYVCTIIGLESGTTYHVRAYALRGLEYYYGDDKSFTTEGKNGGGGGEGWDNHAFVDLGLPSGLLWATCNVGAETPEDFGDYFSWGETQPKDIYDWSTYQYCTGGYYEYPYYNMFTKYCNKSNYGYNGFTDNLTTLLPEDDAASAKWGSGWRIPTKEEWQELLDHTTNIWTTQNGVNGRLFTASNGNSLFLPAAGRRWVDGLDDAGNEGDYWSSSLRTDNPYGAWLFNFFGSNYTYVNGSDRHYGQSVRAVREN